MTATNRADIARRVERSKREILDDIRDGVQPSDVASFSELHDHVDANAASARTTRWSATTSASGTPSSGRSIGG